jgi:hypothetical protein
MSEEKQVIDKIKSWYLASLMAFVILVVAECWNRAYPFIPSWLVMGKFNGGAGISFFSFLAFICVSVTSWRFSRSLGQDKFTSFFIMMLTLFFPYQILSLLALYDKKYKSA